MLINVVFIGPCKYDADFYLATYINFSLQQMIVVPDNITMKKVPNIEGMMVYRKDKNKLYVQEDKQLNALAEEKKVKNLKMFYES